MSSQFIHPTAQVHPSSVIVPDNTIVGQNSQVGPEVSTGVNVTIGSDTKIYSRVHIGHNVTIGSGVTMVGPLEIGPNVKIADRAIIGLIIAPDSCLLQASILVGAHIGAGAQVYGRLEVGEYACLQAGACLQGDLPHHGLAGGNPAALIDFICECGRPYKVSLALTDIFIVHCPACRSEYRISRDTYGRCRRFLLPNKQPGELVPAWWQPDLANP
jgi:UDP-2-acetamido-3-amino-2,3-dideoxy-glucuronate N-acetyltransferase